MSGLTWTILGTNLVLNINFEVDNLARERSELNFLSDQFTDIVKERDNIIDKVFCKYA